MSTYTWHDPTLPDRIGRRWVWSHVLKPLHRITIYVAKRGRNEEIRMEFEWEEWCQICDYTSEFNLDWQHYRHESTDRMMAFGWAKIARREYQEVMHIRGIWDEREISIKIPKEHWFDIVAALKIRPSTRERERLSLLFED